MANTSVFKNEQTKKHLVVLLAFIGTAVGIVAVALNSGWIPSTLVLGMTSAEVGLIGGVAVVFAMFVYLI